MKLIKITCPVCETLDNYDNNLECPVCNGKGSVLIPPLSLCLHCGCDDCHIMAEVVVDEKRQTVVPFYSVWCPCCDCMKTNIAGGHPSVIAEAWNTRHQDNQTITLQSRAITEWQDKCMLLEIELKRLKERATDPARIEVDREKLKNLIVKWAECKSCPLNTFNENNKMVCTANVTTKRDCYLAVTNYLQKNDND